MVLLGAGEVGPVQAHSSAAVPSPESTALPILSGHIGGAGAFTFAAGKIAAGIPVGLLCNTVITIGIPNQAFGYYLAGPELRVVKREINLSIGDGLCIGQTNAGRTLRFIRGCRFKASNLMIVVRATGRTGKAKAESAW